MVLDASAVVEWLLRTPRGLRVERLVQADPILMAPHLLDAEVAAVMRRAAMAGQIEADRAALALDTLASSPIHRYPHGPMLRRVFDLRHNVSAYDALYLVLAEALEATLVTADARLARAAAGRVPTAVL